MRVAAIQHDVVWEDREATLRHIEPMVASAVQQGAALIVLPEMFAVGFSMRPERVAEPPGGPTCEWLLGQASSHGVWIGGSVPERADDMPRNVFVLASPSGELHRYAKIHPFTYSGEHERYGAGTEHVTIQVDGLRASLFVCYDLRFGDEFWGLARGTDVYLVPANWPAKRGHHWRSLLVARAIENQAYVVGCNRVGRGHLLDYDGDSCIVDPMGVILDSAGDGAEAIVIADVDPAVVRSTRERFPFIADRRS